MEAYLIHIVLRKVGLENALNVDDDILLRSENMKQTDQVIAYLYRHGAITPIDALQDLGIFRLAARIYDIEKQHGIEIPRRTVTAKSKKTGKTVKFTEYQWAKDLSHA